MRVMVAMSGGVDSSVAAGLMVEAGHEVVGLTMKLRDTGPEERAGRTSSCCSPDDLMDARQVCDTLGIAHYIVDYREVFFSSVIQPFAESYLAGQTPNPCVLCNDHVKFKPLLERARALGADALATGHYAQVTESDGRYALRKAVCRDKDQSYFLFGLGQDELSRLMFPLGDMDKGAVRELAQQMGLPIWDKADSEDICFVPGGDYGRVVEKVVGEARVPSAGSIVDESGARLGQHRGVHRYTIGQRKGLGVSGGDRLYVLSVDASTDTVTVGPRARLMAAGLRAERCVWVDGARPGDQFEASVRFRYRSQDVPAEIIAADDRMLVRFDAPRAAVAPGQAVVVYRGDVVLGGGWIETAITDTKASDNGPQAGLAAGELASAGEK